MRSNNLGTLGGKAITTRPMRQVPVLPALLGPQLAEGLSPHVCTFINATSALATAAIVAFNAVYIFHI